MFLYNAFAVRAIVTSVTLLVGLSTPPILFDLTTKLLSCGFLGTELPTAHSHSDLKLLSQDSGFTFSLEWSLFRPNRVDKTDDVLNVESVFAVSSSDHFEVNSPLIECAFESTEQLSPVYNNLKLLSSDSAFNLSLEWSLFKPNSRCCVEKPLQTDKQLFESVRESTHLFINSSLDFDAITLHPLPNVHSVTGPFMMTTPLPPQPIFFGFNHTTEVDSSCLAYLKQLKLYFRELILNSLPTHWAKWTTHNRLTLGLICVSIMYGSLLFPLLHYLWTQNIVNKRLSNDLKVVCGLKLSVDLQLFKITMERNALNWTNAAQFKELLDLKTQLRQCQLQEVEALDKLVFTEKELRKEKWDGGDSRRRIYSEHAKVLAEVNKKLDNTQRSLSWFQILECKAQMELRSVKKQLDEERKQRNNKEMSTTELFTELQQDLQKAKHALKGNIEAVQQKLRLTTGKAFQLKIRLSESVIDSGIDAKDSGIFLLGN